MKKILLRVMAILAMALCFTACGDDDEKPEKKQVNATESGASLYDNYKNYSSADTETTEGQAQKLTAAINLINAYSAYQDNKDNDEWKKEFASSALSAVAEAEKENAQVKLTEALSQKIDASTGDKIKAVANLANALASVF